jgi:hypothetical protein
VPKIAAPEICYQFPKMKHETNSVKKQMRNKTKGKHHTMMNKQLKREERYTRYMQSEIENHTDTFMLAQRKDCK